MLTYEEAIEALESRPIMPDRPPSLEQTRRGLEALLKVEPFPIRPERVVLVAGTNGKGSVAATLESLLISAGQSVGLYTSPHLVRTTERIRMNGAEISKTDFAECYSRVIECTSGLALTHFEVLTLMAVEAFFSRQRVEWAIFEVGLGGRWDATNAIPHEWAILTPVGMDHQNLLGNTLEEIAANKMGILDQAKTVIHSPFAPEVEKASAPWRDKADLRWIEAPIDDYELEVKKGRLPEFHVQTPWGSSALRLSGKRGAENSILALQAFEALGFSPKENISALSQVNWPGRMQEVHFEDAPCPVLLSGDHNVPGINSLLALLPHYSKKRLHILCGIGVEKDAAEMLTLLEEIPGSELYLTETPFNGLALKNYPAKFLKSVAGADEDPMAMLQKIFTRASEEDLILVTGSLYLVGKILAEHSAARASLKS